MQTSQAGWRENLRIIWAITAKDLLEAVKNKNTIAVLLTSLFMVLFYRMMPVIFASEEPVNVLAYDAGNSKLVALLDNSPNLDLYTYASEEKLKQVFASGDRPELGLVIPADFDQRLAAGEPVNLQGYQMYWVQPEDAAELKAYVEAEIARLIGRPVPIQTEGNLVYHRPDSDGLGVQAGFGVIFILVMVGLSLVAHLFLEEKQSRTIDSLLVSPATAGHIVAGKAITGLVYGLLGAGVALAINQNLILHWWLAILTVIATALFTVSLGLLLGAGIENRGQLTLWAWVFLMPLLIPMFLVLLDPLVPPAVIQVSRLIPTVTSFNLLRTSFADPIPLGSTLLQLAWVLLWAGGLMAVTAWFVQRQETATDAPSPWAKARPAWLNRYAQAVQERLGLDNSAAKALPIGEPADIQAPSTKLQVQTPDTAQLDSSADFSPSQPAGWRITLVIAAKDIREALQNKIFISLILGVGVMIASNAVVPLLLRQNDAPAAYIYDEGRSTIIRGLVGSEDFQIRLVDSKEELEKAVTEAPATRIGLILPADFDRLAGSDQGIQLDGYYAHWADREKILRWAAFFEEQLGLAAWTQVSIRTDGHILYPGPEIGGNPMMVILLLVIVIATLGVALVPLLLVEEKESHTLEAILVSPTSFAQLISGKALAGAAFCLLAALVVILFHAPLFVNWWVVLLAVVLSTTFAVITGLLIGVISDNPATTGIWGGLIILSLSGLTITQFLARNNWPPLLQSLLSWFPGLHLVNLFQFSMAGTFQLTQLMTSMALLAAEIGVLVLLIGLFIRRSYR